MDRAVVQALDNLVPALSGPLPPELIELAVSLLAQSRNKASSLKADEEIARSYACANIACERLKQSLALPKIHSRPPCPPKVYQKLYRYLDSALPAGTRKSGRATKPNGSVLTSTSSPAKPRTPAKAAHVRPDTPRRKTPHRRPVVALEVPSWVMPAIRQLCKKMSAPGAPHHICAGVSSILSSLDTNEAEEIKIPPLIVALYLLVTTRLDGVSRSAGDYAMQRTRASKILEELVVKGEEQRTIEEVDIEKCVKKMRERQWTEMDWFSNIPVGAGTGESDAEAANDGSDDDDDVADIDLLPTRRRNPGLPESLDTDYLQAGLGTMMQDRVDYISDERRRDYQNWKRNILIQIEKLEKGEEMDLGAG